MFRMRKSDVFLRRLVLLGTPLALTILMLLHPSPYDDIASELVPIAGWWITLHTVQFVLFALMGAAVWLLVAGLRGIAANLARAGAAIFVVFYDAGDAVAGIATGILARAIAEDRIGERAAVEAIEALFADPTKNVLFQVGIYAWMVALAAAAVALYRAGAPRPSLLLLAPAAFFLNFDHAFPFGALVFVCFFLAAAWIELASEKTGNHADGKSQRVR